MYVDIRLRFAFPTRDARLTARAADAGGIAASRIRSNINYRADTAPFGYLMFLNVDQGRLRVRHGRQETFATPGQSVCVLMDSALEMEIEDYGVRTLQLPMNRVADVAEETSGVAADRLGFTGMEPVSPAMAQYWRAVSTMAGGALLADDSPLNSPLIAAETIRTVAVAALHTFPNSTMTVAHLRDPSWTAPATVRRAMDYIDAHADQPITTAEIAAAAGIGSRALQLAFRRHQDLTPMGYLRRVRLHHAHRELQAADPSAGDTVAAIARRWGFGKPDRFAAAYRRLYGVPPSHTLRH